MSCSLCKRRGHNKATCARNTEKIASDENKHKEIRSALGTKPDTEIARDFGVSRQWVFRLRQRWKIPLSFDASNPERYHPGIMARLGVDPDAEVARDYGISPQRIAHLRQERKIPAPTKKQKSET